MRALIKVIVPCYGYATLLESCVDSVLRQEGVDVRVLIVDDCSPDETANVAGGVLRGDRRVEYRRHSRNTGLVATANEGLEWAEDGDYLVLLSADDMLVPGALRRAAAVMEACPAVGLVYGRAPYLEAGRPPPRVDGRWRGTTVWPGTKWIRRRCRAGHNCISSPEVVVRTSVQRRAGHYDPACRHAGDLNMWLRIAAISDVAYVRGAAQALYRIHPDSMLRGMLHSPTGPLVDLKERRAAFEQFFAAVDGGLRDGGRLRTAAARALARQALWQASRAYDRGDASDDAGAMAADELAVFALNTYPDARRLPEWWGLRLRQRLGAGRSLWFAPFLATGAAHRLRGRVARLRWRLRGI